MANSELKTPATGAALPHWRAPQVLFTAAVRSSSLLGHDLINRFRAERYELFLSGHFALWATAGGVLPLLEYAFWYRTPFVLLFAAVGVPQCIALAFGLRLARLGRYSASISLVCVTNWISSILVTLVDPNLFPVMALVALVPVVFAEPYIRWQRGLAFTVITAVCVLAMAMLARLLPISDAVEHGPRWLETLVIVVGVPFNAFHLLVIAWNNAAALRTSEGQLAEHAAELAASRTRLTTAADEERRRLERDLHDGAQQHLVALSVLLGLARKSDRGDNRQLLAEASELVETSIVEIRRLAHGIYPPLLVSGGLTEALPTLAARAAVPVHLDLDSLGRYPPSTEAAFYYCCSEALQNAVKHGGPHTTVTVEAHADGQTLTLSITDTGRGFDPATIGHGLVNMRDRLAAIGGALVIDTAPGRGTRITAVVDTSA
jgi:signal transduction histidine kinase